METFLQEEWGGGEAEEEEEEASARLKDMMSSFQENTNLNHYHQEQLVRPGFMFSVLNFCFL